MGKKTWCAEFYPKAAASLAFATELECVEHSLKKWTGLRAENLAKHKVQTDDPNKMPIQVTGATCALCVRSSVIACGSADWAGAYCAACVLFKIRNNVACDITKHDDPWNEFENPDAPYLHFSEGQPPNPEPMIELLERAKQHLLNEADKQ